MDHLYKFDYLNNFARISSYGKFEISGRFYL